MASLLSLIIYRSTGADDTNFTELNSINVFQSSGHVIENTHDSQTSTGVIDANSQSYLSLVWEYPDATKAGFYVCEANGMNFAGHPVATNRTVTVFYYYPDVNDLVSEIRYLSSKIEQLSKTVENQIGAIDGILTSVQDLRINQQTWSDRIPPIKRLQFKDTISYNNHNYYLSNPKATHSIEDFETICEFFGGYLVEIDSIDEFNNLRGMVSKHPEMEYVMTGATGEGHEGHWVNIHSGTVVQDIQWMLHQPSNNSNYNCLWFWSKANWYMIEGDCSLASVQLRFGFMCEMPE